MMEQQNCAHSKYYEFPCGCKIPIINGIPQIDFETISLDCPKTWDVYKSGQTQSIFQLEKYLGKKYSKELKPESMEDAAALIAIIRPGVLQAVDEDGKNLTQVFCDRKKNNWKPNQLSISEKMLEKTMGLWCIHEDTYVSMADGTEKQIKNINKKDKLLSVSPDRKIMVDECCGIGLSPKKVGYELKLSNGYSCILTEDHKVLTQNGMVELRNLNKDKDVVAIGLNQSICNNSLSNSILESKDFNWLSKNKEHIAYLCGQLIGDGCAGRKIASGTKENNDKLLAWLNKNFSSSLIIKDYFRIRSFYIDLIGKELANDKNYGNRKTKYSLFLEKLFLNLTKNNKIISDEIMIMSEKCRLSFLAGLFDADGHSSKNGCHIASNNSQILNCVRKILSMSNIESYINNCHIHITNTKKFKKIIEKYLVIKNIHVNTYGYLYGSYPCSDIKSKIVSSNQKIRPFCKKNSISRCALYNNNKKFVSIKFAEKAGFVFNDISFMKIKSISKVECPLTFYSISVLKNHNLIGNGIVISNCYQEQVMEVTQQLANFNGPNQMKLVKSIGKKQSDLLISLKQKFIDGCKSNNISEEDAIAIFDNIEKSGRYLFNKSHSVGYAVMGYWTAWVKAHLPHHYICAWLRNAKNEQKPLEEIRAVISEARRLKIDVMPPSITNLPTTNFFISNNIVYFGLDSIKGCGTKGLQKLLELDVSFQDLSWLDFLVMYSDRVNKTQITNMIRCGCFDYTGTPRIKCEFEYNQWGCLSKKDREKAQAIYNSKTPLSLSDLISFLKEETSAKRQVVMDSIILALEEPPISLLDTVDNIVDHEKELMGINVSCSKMQKAEIPETKNKCGDVEKLDQKNYLVIGEISEFREIKIKNGKMAGQIMASFVLSDEDSHCECVIFPKELNYYQGGLYDGNIVMIEGTKSNRGNGIIVNKIFEV